MGLGDPITTTLKPHYRRRDGDCDTEAAETADLDAGDFHRVAAAITASSALMSLIADASHTHSITIIAALR